MKEKVKTLGKIQVSDGEIANISYRVQNTGNEDAHRNG